MVALSQVTLMTRESKFLQVTGKTYLDCDKTPDCVVYHQDKFVASFCFASCHGI